MTRDELRTIVTYCPTESCGDAVGGLSRSARNTKRQMAFVGFVYWLYAKYQCPVCYYTRLFRLSFWETHYVPKDADSARREARIGIAIIAIVIIVLSGADSLRRRSKAKARETAVAESRSLLEAAKIVTEEMIDIKPEFAEVYRDRQIRVLFTAKIRDSAAAEPTMFAPVLGYFLDQDGNRYDPAVMLVGDETVLDSPPPIPIVPGQTYRYYLVAPTQSSPYSNALPSKRLKKLVVHLRGKAPQQVSIKKPEVSMKRMPLLEQSIPGFTAAMFVWMMDATYQQEDD